METLPFSLNFNQITLNLIKMNSYSKYFVNIAYVLLTSIQFCSAQSPLKLGDFLDELTDKTRLAQFPEPFYQSLQASSYNRESIKRNQSGWFADSDGIGFIRTEQIGNHKEWVVMEHNGPGVITKMWAPYFYLGGLDDLEGPDIHIYLDGSSIPVISENYFKLITGRGSFPSPLAQQTARAGNSYFPIPYAKSCKITFTQKPFYHIINYRAYSPKVKIESFTRYTLESYRSKINSISSVLNNLPKQSIVTKSKSDQTLMPAESMILEVKGTQAINNFEIKLDPKQIQKKPELLRNLVLKADFDSQNTIWVPLGDFFCSANAINPMKTWTRIVESSGYFQSSWIMPFKTDAKLSILNLGKTPVKIEYFKLSTQQWKWNDQSMYFYTTWRPDELVQGSNFSDWNFLEVKGKGVLVGDAWTVLNPDFGWWGEGDEKIYVDKDWENLFPSHFGTGTEDYYGWAGGENPSKDDIFSQPFLANVVVGSATPKRRDVRGFNICTRIRSLDAIPFNNHLVFDMEASPGVDIRNPWDYLGYSSVVFWYGATQASHNRPPQQNKAQAPIMTLTEIDALKNKIKSDNGSFAGAIEVQSLKSSISHDNIQMSVIDSQDSNISKYYNNGNYQLINCSEEEGWVEYLISEQFTPAHIKIQFIDNKTTGWVQCIINGQKAGDKIVFDQGKQKTATTLDLGTHKPISNEFRLRVLMGKDKSSPLQLSTAIDFITLTR